METIGSGYFVGRVLDQAFTILYFSEGEKLRGFQSDWADVWTQFDRVFADIGENIIMEYASE